MLSIAKSGKVVIIGRGSFVSLGKYTDVLDAMIYAPMDIRVKAIMEMRDIADAGEAEKYIISKEEVRKTFIEHTYNVRWNQYDNFDMVFNTGKLNPDLVIDTIVAAGKELESKVALTSGLVTSDIEADKVLDNTVKNILKR
jgi:cytidylate kinase